MDDVANDVQKVVDPEDASWVRVMFRAVMILFGLAALFTNSATAVLTGGGSLVFASLPWARIKGVLSKAGLKPSAIVVGLVGLSGAGALFLISLLGAIVAREVNQPGRVEYFFTVAAVACVVWCTVSFLIVRRYLFARSER